MSDIKLGTTPPENAGRDAIHAAIIPVMASTYIDRAGPVILKNGRAEACSDLKYAVGIVDPFLQTGGVERGERFWLLLNPGTVTGIRHHWSHPAFPEQERGVVPTSAAELYLRNFAAEVKLTYEQLLELTGKYVSEGETTQLGEYISKYEWDMPVEFWDAYEKLTGKRGSDTIFTCCPN